MPSRLAIRLALPVVLVLSPLLVLEAVRVSQAHEAAIEEALAAVQEAADHAADHHEHDLSHAERVLRALAGRTDITRPTESCPGELSEIADVDPLFLNLGVIAADGTVLCSAVPPTGNLNLSGRGYFQRAMQTGEYSLGTYQVGLITGQPSLNVALPFGVAPPPRGVVFAALSLGSLADSVEAVALEERASLLILDAAGATLASVGVDDPRPADQRAEVAPEALRRAGLLAAWEPLGDAGAGSVLVVLPEDAATAAVWAQLRTDLAVTLGAASLGLAAAFVLFARLVGRPVGALTSGMRRVEAGDYDTRLDDALPGEFGELARGFNGMTLAIEEHREALLRQTSTDLTTGLPNRHALQQWLTERLARGERVACVYVTIAGFHEITATFGYPAADQLLTEVGGRLREQVPLALVCRIGGNSFALGLVGEAAALSRLHSVGEQTLAAFRAPFTVRRVPVPVDALAGVATAPDHATDADLLLRRAEAAARSGGERHLVFDPEQDEPRTNNIRLLSDLYAALESWSLELHYQPLVDVEGQCHDVEALIRWQHEGEYVPPGVFIPVAERSGVMRLIDRWVFREAVAQARRWQDAGLDLAVSVNLSIRSLEDLDFPEYASELLASSQLPPRLVTVELTETALVQFVGDALEVCQRLNALGVAFAIDDFGVGHSPVQYLRWFPVRRIKLDASLVRDLEDSRQAHAITRSLLQMAADLGIQSVGEGVEHARELELLRSLGCDLTQGYLHARPMPPDALVRWIEEGGASTPARAG